MRLPKRGKAHLAECKSKTVGLPSLDVLSGFVRTGGHINIHLRVQCGKPRWCGGEINCISMDLRKVLMQMKE